MSINKLRLYLPLLKSPQTGLLISTGLAGFMSVKCPVYNLTTLAGLFISLAASISGSTILNMWWDRDIDAQMERTHNRPLPAGKISPDEALRVGLVLSLFGVALAAWMNALFGLIIFAGLFFDVLIYSVWLKRLTCWSIIWGGISGGMPILAGRALGLGELDWTGVLLSLSILFWIPTHIMTFSIKYSSDYKAAGIPTFPSTYGLQLTRITIAVSCLIAALAMGVAAWEIGITIGYLRILAVLSSGLLLLAVGSVFKPNDRLNFGLFKYASLYMLSSMLLMIF